MSLFGSNQNLYNLSNFVGYVANSTDAGFGPVLGILILIALPFLAFMTMKAAFSFDRAFAASGFFGFILGVFLLYLGLITMTIFVIYSLIFALAIWMVMKERGGEET